MPISTVWYLWAIFLIGGLVTWVWLRKRVPKALPDVTVGRWMLVWTLVSGWVLLPYLVGGEVDAGGEVGMAASGLSFTGALATLELLRLHGTSVGGEGATRVAPSDLSADHVGEVVELSSVPSVVDDDGPLRTPLSGDGTDGGVETMLDRTAVHCEWAILNRDGGTADTPAVMRSDAEGTRFELADGVVVDPAECLVVDPEQRTVEVPSDGDPPAAAVELLERELEMPHRELRVDAAITEAYVPDTTSVTVVGVPRPCDDELLVGAPAEYSAAEEAEYGGLQQAVLRPGTKNSQRARKQRRMRRLLVLGPSLAVGGQLIALWAAGMFPFV